MGDVNSNVRSSLEKRLLKVARNVGSENVVKEPTRITVFLNTTIDLIFTSNKSKVKVAGSYDPGISDHHLIFAVVNLRRQKSSPVIKEVIDFKNVNCELFRQDLNSAPWSICGIFDDIDDVAFGLTVSV